MSIFTSKNKSPTSSSLIGQCRTGKLGAHKEQCNSCGHQKIHYNSCGNRHCPNCQGVNKERWFLDRSYDLLPVKYFHGVFTVPSELRNLFRYNKKLLYSLLFKCSWETIKEFALDKRQKMCAKAGMIGILHTWNQRMIYHPHLHCIIPGGGINARGEWKTTKGKKDFLFSVKALSSKFKMKFLHERTIPQGECPVDIQVKRTATAGSTSKKWQATPSS